MRNQEKVRENVKKWRKENREKYNEYARNYWKEKRRRLKELEEELEETKNTLEHRDSFFSIMRDVLANDDLTDEDIAEILYAVVHFECGDENLSKRNVEIAEKFWFRDYV